MKRMKKYLTLLLALVLCLSMTACGSDGADEDNLYDVPDSFEGLVKDSEQMANLYVYGGAWRGEDGSTMIVATSESGDEVRFALYNADEEVTASGFIQFVPEYDYDYFYNEHDGVAYRSWFDEVGAMYVAAIGTFTKLTGDAPGENIGDGDYRMGSRAQPASLSSTRPAAGRFRSVPAATATPPWWTAAPLRWIPTARERISPFPTWMRTWSTT